MVRLATLSCYHIPDYYITKSCVAEKTTISYWRSTINGRDSQSAVCLHPLFYFWKHGSVCDHKKQGPENRVQKIGSGLEKKIGCWSFFVFKTGEAA